MLYNVYDINIIILQQGVDIMKERLKNELILIVSSYVEDVDVLKQIDQKNRYRIVKI